MAHCDNNKGGAMVVPLKLLMLVTFICLPSLCFAQTTGTIIGTALDGLGNTIAGATVTACPQGSPGIPCSPVTASTTSNGQGAFSMTVPVSTYTVTVFRLGIVATSSTVVVAPSNITVANTVTYTGNVTIGPGSLTVTNLATFNAGITGTGSIGSLTAPYGNLTGFPSACGSNQFATQIGSTPGCTQPAFSNLSGTIASAQFGSQSANTFLAAPNGSAGNPTFRGIAGADIPATTSNCSGVQFAQGLNAGHTPVCTTPPTFVASGASHAVGYVPDPGSSAGTTHFLREDATWATVPAGGVTEASFGWCLGGASCPLTAAYSGSNAQSGSAITLTNTHTLIRFDYSLTVSSGGCSTLAVIGVKDITSSTTIFSTSIANLASVGYVDSGALSTAMTAGHQFAIGVLTVPSGCTTSPQAANLTAVYQ